MCVSSFSSSLDLKESLTWEIDSCPPGPSFVGGRPFHTFRCRAPRFSSDGEEFLLGITLPSDARWFDLLLDDEQRSKTFSHRLPSCQAALDRASHCTSMASSSKSCAPTTVICRPPNSHVAAN